MPAQVEFHTQAQETYDYFGHHHRRQQGSQEEVLQVARDYHCQTLAAAAMLEGHMEWLSCSISWGWYGAGGDWTVTSGQKAGGIPGTMAIPGAAGDAYWPDPRNRQPQQKATLGMQPGDKQIPLALCGPGGQKILPAWHTPRGTQIPPV